MIEVIIPKAGIDMQEGTIVSWLKEEGETVTTGEPILEIVTDKVNMEVEAEGDGVLAVITHDTEGEVLPVFTVIGAIAEKGEDPAEIKAKILAKEDVSNGLETETQVVEEDKIAATNEELVPKVDETGKVRATPAARKKAKENEVDLLEVEGSGPNGRVHLADVLNYLKVSSLKATPLAMRIAKDLGIDIDNIVGTGFNGKITKEDVEKYIDQTEKASEISNAIGTIVNIIGEKEIFNTVNGYFEALTPMRSTVARRMSESYFSAPTFNMNIEVDMSELKNLREKLINSVQDVTGYKLTYTDLIVMAVSRLLKKNPVLNSAWVEDKIFRYEEVNIALAVGLEEGLYVPVIRDCDKKTLSQIVTESKELINKVKTNKLKPSEQEGSTFTISNVGMYGITTFTPIINMPNSAILGVGATVDRVVPVDGEIKIRPIMNLSLTSDHRVVDGTPAAKFLKELKDLLENPYKMFI
ncbi:MAG: 2-oxo acid dehydrogenase subunit E2 [Intestinibacter sp.]|uniref:2-oxo acid dehydrogenase subunit E2 n=1 Tax=Intestinibacter sp. TaxID=1965304 RepID=UPI003F18D7AF